MPASESLLQVAVAGVMAFSFERAWGKMNDAWWGKWPSSQLTDNCGAGEVHIKIEGSQCISEREDSHHRWLGWGKSIAKHVINNCHGNWGFECLMNAKELTVTQRWVGNGVWESSWGLSHSTIVLRVKHML